MLYVHYTSKLGKKQSEMGFEKHLGDRNSGSWGWLGIGEWEAAAPWLSQHLLLGVSPDSGRQHPTASRGSCRVPCACLSSGRAHGQETASWNQMWRTPLTDHGCINGLNPHVQSLFGLSGRESQIALREGELPCPAPRAADLRHFTHLPAPSVAERPLTSNWNTWVREDGRDGEPSCTFAAGW